MRPIGSNEDVAVSFDWILEKFHNLYDWYVESKKNGKTLRNRYTTTKPQKIAPGMVDSMLILTFI